MSSKVAFAVFISSQKALLAFRCSRHSSTSGINLESGVYKGDTTKLMKPSCPLGTAHCSVSRSQRGDTGRSKRFSSSPWFQNSLRTRFVHLSMIGLGLHGLEMSAAWRTVSSVRSLFSRARCFCSLSSAWEGLACSSTKILRSCTDLACFPMSVARTICTRALRTYCCKFTAGGAPSACCPDGGGARKAVGSSWYQLQARSFCMISKLREMCMFSRMLLSLYLMAIGDRVFCRNRFWSPGWPTSWIAPPIRVTRWSRGLVCVCNHDVLKNHSTVTTTSAAWTELW
mmetsp:Transcript_79220/g.236049  ORF Transcript_79220/g.236049 Transcript_79220/m.236049 type:complete len:285 (+) Transcript_79220:217-1071(+)